MSQYIFERKVDDLEHHTMNFMNGKVDWNIFAYKFRNNPAQAFETLTYHMFCREFGIVDGLPALYNQKYIETQRYLLRREAR